MIRILILPIAFLTLLVTHIILKSEHSTFKSLSNIISGISALTFMKAALAFVGVLIPLNIFTVIFSLLLGLPGVSMIMALNLIIN